MRRAIRLLVALGLILFATAFTVLNSGFIGLNLYFYELEAPISVLVFVCVAVGALLGLIVSSGAVMRRRREIRRLTKTVSRLESDKADVRKEPESSNRVEQSSPERTA